MNNKFHNNLTIILLLKGKQKFTKRFVDFYVNSNLKYKLLLADGDKKIFSNKIFTKLKKNNINFEYHKFNYDLNYKQFIKKIYLSLNLVKTKYVMLFDNDDFPIKDSIDKCLLKLENTKDLIGCGGYLINFDLFNKDYKYKNNSLSGNAINLAKMNFGVNYIKSKKLDRVSLYLQGKKHTNTINDIFRTKILKNNYKFLKDLKFDYIFLYFLVGDILNYSSGKLMKLNIPFIAHQHHQNGLSMKMKNIYESLDEKDFIEQKKILYKVLSKRFKKLDITNMLDQYFFSIKLKSKSYNLKFHNNIKKKTTPNILNLFLKLIYKNLKNYYLKFNNTHINKFIKIYKNKKLVNEINKIFDFIKKYS